MIYFYAMSHTNKNMRVFSALLTGIYLVTSVGVDSAFANTLSKNTLSPRSLFDKKESSKSFQLEILAEVLSNLQSASQVKDEVLKLLNGSRQKRDGSHHQLSEYVMRESLDGRSLYLFGKSDILLIAKRKDLITDPFLRELVDTAEILPGPVLEPTQIALRRFRKTDLMDTSIFRKTKWVAGQEFVDEADLSLGIEIAKELGRYLSMSAEEKDLFEVALAYLLRYSGITRGGRIKVDADMKSLLRAGEILQRLVKGINGESVSPEIALKILLRLRSHVPEIFGREKVAEEKSFLTSGGEKSMQRLKKDARIYDKLFSLDLPSFLGELREPKEMVAVVDDENLNKFQKLDRALELSGFFQDVDKKWQSSGKTKEDFSIVIKPNIMMTLLRKEDAIITDPTLVLHLIRRLMERGYSRVSIIEAQNVYGSWFKNRGVINVAGNAGYFDKGDKIYPIDTASYEAKIWVEGREQSFMIYDLTNEKVPQDHQDKPGHWVGSRLKEADYVIDFAKPKTHASTLYTGFLKNYYGALPAQNKLNEYHNRLGIDEETVNQLERYPVDFCIGDFGIVADGWLGWKMRRIGKRTQSIMAGKDIIAMEIVTGMRMGVDPFENRFLAKAIDRGYPVRPYKITGTSSLKPFQPWNKAPLWISKLLSAIDRSYWMSNFLGFLFTGFVDRDQYQEFGLKNEKGKWVVFTWRPLSIFLKTLLVFPMVILTATNLDVLTDVYQKIKDLLIVFRDRNHMPASWKALCGPYWKRLAFRLLRFFTNVDKADPFDYLASIRHLESGDMIMLHELIARNRSTLSSSTAQIERNGQFIRVNQTLRSFTSLSPLSVQEAFQILNGIQHGKWSVQDVLEDLRGRLSLKGISIVGTVLFDWMASTKDTRALSRVLENIKNKEVPLDGALAQEALLINPNLDIKWIRSQAEKGLISSLSADELKRAVIHRSIEKLKRKFPAMNLQFGLDVETTEEIPEILGKIDAALIGKFSDIHLTLYKDETGAIKTRIDSSSPEERSLLKRGQWLLNRDLSPDFIQNTHPGGIHYENDQWDATAGSHPSYRALVKLLRGDGIYARLVRRKMGDLAASGIMVQIASGIRGGAIRKGDILFLDENLFLGKEERIPYGLLLMLLSREESRRALNLFENMQALVREMDVVLGLGTDEWMKIEVWIRGREDFKNEAEMAKIKEEYGRDVDLLSHEGILSEFVDRFLRLSGLNDAELKVVLKPLVRILNEGRAKLTVAEETIYVQKGDATIPKRVRLSRYMTSDAVAVMKSDPDLGRTLRLATRDHKETFVVQASMAHSSSFIGVIGSERGEDGRFFKEFLLELLSEGKLWKRAMSANVLVDISGEKPVAYFKDLDHRDKRLESDILLFMKTARNRVSKAKKNAEKEENALRRARGIPFFNERIPDSDRVYMSDHRRLMIVGTSRAHELAKALKNQFPDLLRRLEPLVIKFSDRDFEIQTRNPSSAAAADELRAVVKGIMKYYLMSDIHLADLSGADNFFSQDKLQLLLSKLDEVIKDRATLIINGDLLELWQAEISRILKSYPQVFERFRRIRRIIYVIGNHDEAVSSSNIEPLMKKEMGNVQMVRYFMDVEAGLYFEHGHIADPFNNDTIFGRVITWVVGFIERHFYKDAELFFLRIKDKISPLSFLVERDITHYVERIVMHAELMDFYTRGMNPKPMQDRVVGYGHTHVAAKPGVGPINDLLRALTLEIFGPVVLLAYLNSGAWVWKEKRFLSRRGWARGSDLKLWEMHAYQESREVKLDLTDFIEIAMPERDIRFFEYDNLLPDLRNRGEHLQWVDLSYKGHPADQIISTLPVSLSQQNLVLYDQAA